MCVEPPPPTPLCRAMGTWCVLGGVSVSQEMPPPLRTGLHGHPSGDLQSYFLWTASASPYGATRVCAPTTPLQ